MCRNLTISALFIFWHDIVMYNERKITKQLFHGVIMVFLLVLLTFAVIIGIEMAVKARRKSVPVAVSTAPLPQSFLTEKPGERLFHPGHCWAQVSDAHVATIGVDNFAQSVIGRVSSIELPDSSRQVKQGEPLVTLHRGKKILTLVAPLSGKITEVNSELVSNPALLNESPYENGWLVRIAPQNLGFEVRNLLHGITASLWREALNTQLMQWFTPRLGPVMQDGGKLVDNFSDQLSPEEWHKLAKEFFPDIANQ
jgi:glycine cleavage system H protein